MPRRIRPCGASRRFFGRPSLEPKMHLRGQLQRDVISAPSSDVASSRRPSHGWRGRGNLSQFHPSGTNHCQSSQDSRHFLRPPVQWLAILDSMCCSISLWISFCDDPGSPSPVGGTMTPFTNAAHGRQEVPFATSPQSPPRGSPSVRLAGRACSWDFSPYADVARTRVPLAVFNGCRMTWVRATVDLKPLLPELFRDGPLTSFRRLFCTWRPRENPDSSRSKCFSTADETRDGNPFTQHSLGDRQRVQTRRSRPIFLRPVTHYNL